MQPASSSMHTTNDLSVGQRLKAYREQKGLSIEQVAQQLKILPRMVEDIEGENYQALPEPVFIKGYLRLYAELLSVPSQEICHLFDAAYTKHRTEAHKTPPQILQVLESNPHPKPTRYQARQGHKWLPIAIKVLLIVFMVGAIVAGLWQSALFRQNQVENKVESANNSQNRTIALPNVTSPRQSIDTLNLRFSAPTKLRIADANGQELVNTTKQAGETLSVQGQSPFAIELDPATAVEFRFNNNVIDLKPYTVNGVVNFRLSR